MLAVPLALVAAMLYALASVFQQRAAAAEPAERNLSLGLLGGLVRRPLWLLGVAADAAGYGFQFAALAIGTLVVVQPLLVLGLLFALPIGARMAGAKISRRDLLAAAALCAGLALFLAVANPAAGQPSTRPQTWAALLAVGCGVALLLALAGRRQAGPARAVLLSASTGVLYGLASALTKTTGYLLSEGVGSTFLHWEPYALVVVGLAGMLIGQSAFQVGELEVSLPTMSVLDPVVSVLVGALAFGEAVTATPLALAAELVGLLVGTAGVVVLARAPAVRATREQRPV